VTSELVRVAFAFVNGSYLALSGLRPADNIEVQLTHAGISSTFWSGGSGARIFKNAAGPSAVTELNANILAVERSSRVELLPRESKFTRINASSLVIDDGVVLTAELAAYATSPGDGAQAANNFPSSTVSLDVFIGYEQMARRDLYDSFDSFPLVWNATSRRHELLRYVILPFRCVLKHSALRLY